MPARFRTWQRTFSTASLPWPPIPELLDLGRLRRQDLETELCAVVAGMVSGRSSADDVTLFISTGMATWDVAIASWAEGAACRAGLGVELWRAGAFRSLPGLVAPVPALLG